jgi:hypothetical protein
MKVDLDSLRRWVDRWHRERERGWEAPTRERISQFIDGIAGLMSAGEIRPSPRGCAIEATARQLLDQWILGSRVVFALLLLVVVDMVFKPGI